MQIMILWDFVGSGVSYDAQMEAEVPKADVFIAVTEKMK